MCPFDQEVTLKLGERVDDLHCPGDIRTGRVTLVSANL